MNTKITVKENKAGAFHRIYRRMYAPGKKCTWPRSLTVIMKSLKILNRLKTGKDFGKVTGKNLSAWRKK